METFWSGDMDNIMFILRLSNPNHAPYGIRLQLALLFLKKRACNLICATLAERSKVNHDPFWPKLLKFNCFCSCVQCM